MAAHNTRPATDESCARRLLCCLLCAVTVRLECNALGNVSLQCQGALQQRGVDKVTAMQQCASTIDTYKACMTRKSQIDSRRGWWELNYKNQPLQSLRAPNT